MDANLRSDLLEFLEKSRRSHYYCEDSWYNCPAHPDGCWRDDHDDTCDCGADEYNKKLDKMIERITNG